jgi:two-component system OmpR family sensor kinase
MATPSLTAPASQRRAGPVRQRPGTSDVACRALLLPAFGHGGVARRNTPKLNVRVGSAGRLAALHAGVLALALGAVVVVLVRSFTLTYQTAAASAIGGQLRQYQQEALKRPHGQSLWGFSVQFLQDSRLSAGSNVVMKLDGKSLETSGSGSLAKDPLVQSWLTVPPARTVAVAKTVAGVPLELVAAPLRSGPRTVGTYIAASDLGPLAAERSRVFALSLAEAGVALMVAVGSAFFLLRRLLRTVGRITVTAREIGTSGLGLQRRLPDPGGTDEVAELSRTFDVMLDRLEAAMNAQRRLLADVSHQLRTPLTVARGHLEIMNRTGYDDALGAKETTDLVIDELDHMAALVERLLMLGRAMEPNLLSVEPVGLRELLSSIKGSLGALVPRRLSVSRLPDIVVLADREQLRGAIVNLVDNAVHATKEGAAIMLGVALDGASGDVRVVVEDSGPGIPASQRGAALERFARPGARDEGGSGLGLAIAKAVALAHGGAIMIDQSPALGGARVEILLPASRVVSEVS